jgi:hypothetical protein
VRDSRARGHRVAISPPSLRRAKPVLGRLVSESVGRISRRGRTGSTGRRASDRRARIAHPVPGNWFERQEKACDPFQGQCPQIFTSLRVSVSIQHEPSVGRPIRWRLILIGHQKCFLLTGSVGRLLIELGCTCTAPEIDNATTIGRPDRVDLIASVKRKPANDSSFDAQQPDVPIAFDAPVHRDAPAVSDIDGLRPPSNGSPTLASLRRDRSNQANCRMPNPLPTRYAIDPSSDIETLPPTRSAT